jgi:hypothetical protein
MKPSSFLNQCSEAGYLEKGKNLNLTIIEKMFNDVVEKRSPLSADARMIVKRLKATTDNGLKVSDLKIEGYEPKAPDKDKGIDATS